METACHQCSDNTAVNGADERIAGQRASAGRAADKLVVGKTQPAAYHHPDNDAQYNIHSSSNQYRAANRQKVTNRAYRLAQ